MIDRSVHPPGGDFLEAGTRGGGGNSTYPATSLTMSRTKAVRLLR